MSNHSNKQNKNQDQQHQKRQHQKQQHQNKNNQTFIQDKLSAVLNKITELVSCNTKECKRAKEKKILEKKYLKAKLNAKTAPSRLKNAQRNLMVFQGGTAQYNKHMKSELESQAYQIAETFNQNFQEEVSNVNTGMLTYESLLTNYTNVLEFYQRVTKENLLLKKDIAITSGNIITNNRKSIYENQVIDNLQYWYGWIRILYILIIIAYIVGLFLLPWETPRRNYVIVFIILCIYPFIINTIVNWLFTMYHSLTSYFMW